MSQREANQMNKYCRAIIMGFAAIMAIVTVFYNPGHIITTGIIFAVGLEAEFFKGDEFEFKN